MMNGNIVRQGQSWIFTVPPTLIAAAAIGGPKEGKGPLGADFDYLFADNRDGQESFEQMEQKMLQIVCEMAIAKAGCVVDDMDFFLCGDLLNQITSSGFTARALSRPYFGLFAACATAIEGVILGSLLIASGAANKIMCAAGSHTCTAERQFRYPNEYGCQKPPQSQYTTTAAGAAVIGSEEGTIKITAVTTGRVVDLGVTDSFNMGGAMAPAFADTITAHLLQRGVSADYYDLILSGDLGRVGRDIALDLLYRRGIVLNEHRYVDCGCLIYGDDKSVFAGGSGCGCVASVSFGHIYRRLMSGELNRVLIAATGALLSPTSSQQKQSIPGISHAVALERI